MPDFIAVQCFSCKCYQVCQKRKDNKFSCKMCSNKQSVRKIFAHSHKAADVRIFVQQANFTRGRAEECYEEMQATNPEPEKEICTQFYRGSYEQSTPSETCLPPESSKWATYDSVVARAERGNLDDTPGGFQQASHTISAEDIPQEEDFVTALPDRFAQRNVGKRKFRGGSFVGDRKRRAWSGGELDTIGHADEQHVGNRDGHHERNFIHTGAAEQGRKQRHQPRAKGCKSGSLQGSITPTVTKNGARTRSRWGHSSSLQRVPDTAPRAGAEDTVFTSLGRDETVQDDIQF